MAARKKCGWGTEQIPPGGLIAKHKHFGQDEILLIQTGSAHVWLGAEERDVHAGAIVFIPSLFLPTPGSA
jgi:quercetin dioxygenase-like cupin family protein